MLRRERNHIVRARWISNSSSGNAVRPAAYASSFLTFCFPPSSFLLPRHAVFFLAGDLSQLNFPVGMQTVDFSNCRGLTGTAKKSGMRDGQKSPKHIIDFAIQPHTLPHSSPYPCSLFAFPSAGAVDKIVFPEGMQTVDFLGCSGLTGTAKI